MYYSAKCATLPLTRASTASRRGNNGRAIGCLADWLSCELESVTLTSRVEIGPALHWGREVVSKQAGPGLYLTGWHSLSFAPLPMQCLRHSSVHAALCMVCTGNCTMHNAHCMAQWRLLSRRLASSNANKQTGASGFPFGKRPKQVAAQFGAGKRHVKIIIDQMVAQTREPLCAVHSIGQSADWRVQCIALQTRPGQSSGPWWPPTGSACGGGANIHKRAAKLAECVPRAATMRPANIPRQRSALGKRRANQVAAGA